MSDTTETPETTVETPQLVTAEANDMVVDAIQDVREANAQAVLSAFQMSPEELGMEPIQKTEERTPEVFYGAVRVLNCDGVPDSSGDIFTPQTVIELPNHVVNIHSTFDDLSARTVIGWATLSLDKQGVLADIWLFGSAEGLTPAIGGNCTDRNADIMKKVGIYYLVLSYSKNMDKRIKALEAP